jgi:hypothetical protein
LPNGPIDHHKGALDNEADVWIATSEDVHGLVVEADTWPDMIKEVRLVLLDLLELLGRVPETPALTFIAAGQNSQAYPRELGS